MKITIDGGILAGGLSRRMEGNDKGLQLYKHQAMAKWVYQALAPHVRDVYINCNKNHSSYQTISPFTCSDTISGFQGPLAGLVSLMAATDADYLLISPCDTPMLSQSFGKKMLIELDKLLAKDPNQAVIIASKDEHRDHPLHLCISRKFKKSLEQAIERDEHRVMQWVKNNGAHWIDFSHEQSSDDSECFVNFNTLDALRKSQE